MGFSLPQLSSSCCGCTLRTGSLIILWIYLVISILLLCVPPLAQQIPSTNSTAPAGSTTTTPAPSTKIPAVAPLGVLDVIIGIINIVVGSVGLYGVYRDLHLYLLPYLVWEAAFTIQQVVRTIIADFTMGVILGELLVFMIMFYFWLVVYSHYRVLKGSARPIQA